MTIDSIERLNLALGAGAVAAGFALVTPGFAVSLGVGAALEAANFRSLRRSAQVSLGLAPASGLRSVGFGARFALLAVALGAALYAGAHPVGLLIGLSLIIPAVIVEAWRTRPAVDPNAPALPPDAEDWDRWNPWLAREGAEDEEGEP